MSEPSFFSDTLTLVQVAGYVVAVIFGLCALVPTILHLIDFEGHCLLFTNGTWQASDGQFVADWGSQFYCDYNIFWSFFSVLIALTQLVIFAKNAKRNTSKGFLTVLGDLVVCTLVCILVFAGAVMTSVGYNRWCDAILQRFTECEDAASPTTGIDRKDGINTAHFYIHYGIIQVLWSLVMLANMGSVEPLRVKQIYFSAPRLRHQSLHGQGARKAMWRPFSTSHLALASERSNSSVLLYLRIPTSPVNRIM
ncbi:hypothetical protein HAZT_HAZT008908 [Hyalella azteca]|uniref:MARVEL domain-containing protein n=1 Tax=Hyalella azteca TaxID=294128 RepID=A0A6A0HBP3_HYAAZ|nr:hypothetical protein HAZT_HAZT008908 [Hyalella azteca]